MPSYQPRLGDGLAGVYQPPALKRHRYGVSPWALLAIVMGSMVPLYFAAVYGAPLLLVVLGALGHGD